MNMIIRVAALCAFTGGGIAQDMSSLAGKLDLSGGRFDSTSGERVSGSLAGAFSAGFGWQADGMWSEIGSRDFRGIGGHVFWRDPQQALIGFTAAAIDRDGVESTQAGIEVEYYLPRATLAFGGGYAGIRYDEPVFFIDTDADGSYLNGEVRYYLTDDFAVSIGGMRSLGNDLGFASVEYQTPVAGLSFFATSANGDNGYDHTLAGVRYYFGSPKHLKLRHRMDDPNNSTETALWTLGTYGAEYNRRAHAHLSQPPVLLDGPLPLVRYPTPQGYGYALLAEPIPTYRPGGFGVTITNSPPNPIVE